MLNQKVVLYKLTFSQYKFIAEMLWGGYPTDRKWAEETSIFKNSKDQILKDYPLLDKSI
jgi:hypothetical protein